VGWCGGKRIAGYWATGQKGKKVGFIFSVFKPFSKLLFKFKFKPNFF
jgi:hypothetical protein